MEEERKELSRSEDALIEKIVSDGEEEAAKIIAAAEEYYKKTVSEAENAAEEYIQSQRKDTALYTQNLKSGRETLASLEAKKIILNAKQSLVETVYKRAENKLAKIKKAEYMSLIEKLISAFAEEGETVVLSKKCEIEKEEILSLDIVKKLGLKVEKTGDMGGGIILCGKKCDKDLSFAAISATVREKTEAETAQKLFE